MLKKQCIHWDWKKKKEKKKAAKFQVHAISSILIKNKNKNRTGLFNSILGSYSSPDFLITPELLASHMPAKRCHQLTDFFFFNVYSLGKKNNVLVIFPTPIEGLG